MIWFLSRHVKYASRASQHLARCVRSGAIGVPSEEIFGSGNLGGELNSPIVRADRDFRVWEFALGEILATWAIRECRKYTHHYLSYQRTRQYGMSNDMDNRSKKRQLIQSHQKPSSIAPPHRPRGRTLHFQTRISLLSSSDPNKASAKPNPSKHDNDISITSLSIR
jgi:hypothetical protein